MTAIRGIGGGVDVDVLLSMLNEPLSTEASCVQCGYPMTPVDGDGMPEHLVCPVRLTALREPIAFPEGTTLEQKRRVMVLARDFKAVEVNVRMSDGGIFDGPKGWLYVVVLPLRGGDFHAGIEPDGSAHS